MASKTLDEWLEAVQVIPEGEWENDMSGTIIGEWHAVVTDDGIIAYFCDMTDALRFRLDYINRQLNP